MVNLNFVPDDYVRNNETRRTNVLYLILLVVVMTALGGSFITIKIRQRACYAKENLVNTRMAKMKEVIRQFDELQVKKRAMMKTALTTAELLEPVPRSILLASLTNNLPAGVSLINLDMIQKAPKQQNQVVTSSQYQAMRNEQNSTKSKLSPEQSLETSIEIEGIAPSDLQVAAYIERLSTSILIDNVALVESKECKMEDSIFRQFKLTAMLRKEVHLSKEDVETIRSRAEETVWNF
ncbi:MAG: PilN domain-containing protein [Sedimentisphaerales bacterium]|nr:PilN domain-containing protein [Sedimentisphaerales bacterium]